MLIVLVKYILVDLTTSFNKTLYISVNNESLKTLINKQKNSNKF